MKRSVRNVVIGAFIAMPLLYFLELESTGAIALLIFLCVGITFLISGLATALVKRRRRQNGIHESKRPEVLP